MKSVIFVDDNPLTLQNYKKLFSHKETSWRTFFFENAGDAINCLQSKSIDIIISDLEMPVVNGAILLEHVKRISPLTMRIILTGCKEESAMLETVKVAHRIFSKPESFSEIVCLLDRALYLHKLIANPNARALLTQVEHIPSIPALVQEVIIAVQDDNCSLREVAEIISQDMGMTVDILRLVNSHYFGIPNKIVSIEQAVSLLGLDIIKTLMITLHFFETFKSPFQLEMDELLSHSILVGKYTKAIIESENRSASEVDEAFICGFVHDIGKVILLAYFPEKHATFLELIKGKDALDEEIERKLFRITHGEIGAFLLGLWGFSDAIIEAVAYHHEPENAKCEDHILLAALHCADSFEHEIHEQFYISENPTLSIPFLENTQYLPKQEKWLKICEDLAQ